MEAHGESRCNSGVRSRLTPHGCKHKASSQRILADFSVDLSKAVFVTDRGANVLAAMKDWKHIACGDHMLNTVLTTLFAKLNECPRIKALLAGSKELVRYFKKSGLMRHLKTALKQEVSTRWNTMFYLLESVLCNFDEIHHILTR